MNETTTLREATHADLEQMLPLLTAAHLSIEGMLAFGTRYSLATTSSVSIKAIGGLEYGAGVALLRSVLVVEAERSRGIGVRLVKHLLATAAKDATLLCTCLALAQAHTGSD